MRTILLSLFLIMTFGASAAKEYRAVFQCVNAKNGEQIQGVLVSLRIGKKGRSTLVAKTDKNGEISFKWEGKVREVRYRVTDPEGNYQPVFGTITFEKRSLVAVEEIALVPYGKLALSEFRKQDSLKTAELIASGTDMRVYDGSELCDDFVDNEFSGGGAALQQWINNNIRYPQEAIELDEQGRVYLSFIIEPDGTVTHVKVERGVSPSLDFECIRLLYEMPKWKPGTCDGKLVRTVARMPINFTLN
jgi:TonB family protein